MYLDPQDLGNLAILPLDPGFWVETDWSKFPRKLRQLRKKYDSIGPFLVKIEAAVS